MEKRIAALLGAALLCGTAMAQTPEYAEGRLLFLVAPDYPRAALKQGATGSVQVTGKVRLDGRLANPAITATPPNADLEGEVRSVVRYWAFQPRLDPSDCSFRETEARIDIWFDIDAGKPKVSFSKSVAPADAALVGQLRQTASATVSRTVPEYPWHVARNSNAPPLVSQLAYARVNPEGSVRSVSVAPKRYYDDFRQPIVEAVKQWRFRPQASGWCAELPFDFRLP